MIWPGEETTVGDLLAPTSFGVPSQPDSITIRPNRRPRMLRLMDIDGARIESNRPFTMPLLRLVPAAPAKQRDRAAPTHSPATSVAAHAVHQALPASLTPPVE